MDFSAITEVHDSIIKYRDKDKGSILEGYIICPLEQLAHIRRKGRKQIRKFRRKVRKK